MQKMSLFRYIGISMTLSAHQTFVIVVELVLLQEIHLSFVSSKFILLYYDAPDERKAALFERADGQICDWLIRLPRWKMDLVNADGVGDMILFHASHTPRTTVPRTHSILNIDVSDWRSLSPCWPAG